MEYVGEIVRGGHCEMKGEERIVGLSEYVTLAYFVRK